MVCWMGCLSGQTIASIEAKPIKCYGDKDGEIFGTINPGTIIPPYAFDVYLYDIAIGTAPASWVDKTSTKKIIIMQKKGAIKPLPH